MHPPSRRQPIPSLLVGESFVKWLADRIIVVCSYFATTSTPYLWAKRLTETRTMSPPSWRPKTTEVNRAMPCTYHIGGRGYPSTGNTKGPASPSARRACVLRSHPRRWSSRSSFATVPQFLSLYQLGKIFRTHRSQVNRSIVWYCLQYEDLTGLVRLGECRFRSHYW